MSINHFSPDSSSSILSSSPSSSSSMESMHRRKRLAVRDPPHCAPLPSASLAPTGNYQGSPFNSTAPAMASSYSSSLPTSSSDAQDSSDLFDMQLCIHLRDASKYVSFTGRRKALPNIMDLQRASEAFSSR